MFFLSVIAAGLIGLLLYMWYEAHRNVVLKTDIELELLPAGLSGMRVFFISDIHRRLISDKIVDEVNGEADMVIIGGDLAEKGVSFQRIEKNIEKLAIIAPVYFVWGNNDYEIDYRKLDAMLLERGVTILDNTAVKLETGNASLNLLGVDDLSFYRDRLDLALKDSDPGFRILISHNPDIADNIPSDSNIRLILSGHTHGGQIRLFNWGLAQKGGVKPYPNFKLFISNGYGTTHVPLRLFAPSEAHLLRLVTKKTGSGSV